ncbi:hypothetical protein EB796_006767 [Bugula neritina]|uniref:Uncharacterized protein n=1 Tax=Bugula neritina TaxID=10212 RepID=A0A7J7K9L0_BUGNE|nr:hypothetical protein EB796_006767 [Bugula neritina]
MFSHGASKKYSTSLWTLLDKDINKNEGLHIAGTFSVCDYGGSDCSKSCGSLISCRGLRCPLRCVRCLRGAFRRCRRRGGSVCRCIRVARRRCRSVC